MLRSNLCDYSDGYIVAKGRISVRGTNDANKRNKKLTFKNNASFRSCISKINNTFIDSGEDLDIVIRMYNPLEYSDNYSMTGSLWDHRTINSKIITNHSSNIDTEKLFKM